MKLNFNESSKKEEKRFSEGVKGSYDYVHGKYETKSFSSVWLFPKSNQTKLLDNSNQPKPNINAACCCVVSDFHSF